MKIAVVGAGWAGLSAALALRRRGHVVQVFEAARTPGGRARRTDSRISGARLDNGQHVLLGAYEHTLSQIRELGLNPAALFHRISLDLRSADGRFRLRARKLPAPLHLLIGVASARGLPLPARLGMIRAMVGLRLAGWLTPCGMSVAQWLRSNRQSTAAVMSFWRPLCLAALNTPPEEACAQIFAHVLRDSVGAGSHASDVLIPATDLSSLWPDCAVEMLSRQAPQNPAPHQGVRLGHAVRKLELLAQGVLVDGLAHDAVIVATNVPSAQRLLAGLPDVDGAEIYRSILSGFDFIPIATLTLQLAEPWSVPARMLMLWDNAERKQHGQWLFVDGNFAHVVISDARHLQEQDPEEVSDALVNQIRQQVHTAGTLPDVLARHLIVEKRATFRAAAGLRRPSNQTPWRGVWVAGDWTDTGYPGVLEGAVISGQRAARQAATALMQQR